jgi:hypothetical protein
MLIFTAVVDFAGQFPYETASLEGQFPWNKSPDEIKKRCLQEGPHSAVTK